MTKLVAPVRKMTGRAHHSLGTASKEGHPIAAMPFAPATRVEIEPSDGASKACFLIRYDERGSFAGDTWHESLTAAKEQAEWEFGILMSDWREADEP
jgi:hypothetical protein